ncbi:MAG TPA: hypothetical protein DD727_06780, partial [Clostridiales bacterium]|nr:hypothetical protein [Clostridiales bacterium]
MVPQKLKNRRMQFDRFHLYVQARIKSIWECFAQQKKDLTAALTNMNAESMAVLVKTFVCIVLLQPKPIIKLRQLNYLLEGCRLKSLKEVKITRIAAVMILTFTLVFTAGGCKKSSTLATTANSLYKTTLKTTAKSGSAVAKSTVKSSTIGQGNTSEVNYEGFAETETGNQGSGEGDIIEERGSDINISKYEGKINLEGKTIKIYDQWCSDPQNNNMLGREGVSLYYDALLSSVRDSEKKYNCQIIYGKYDIGGSIATVFAQNAVAGLKQPFDAFAYAIGNPLVVWANSNIIAPLDDYINLDAPEVKQVPFGSVANLGQYRGKQWVYPHPAHAVYPAASYNYIYNRRLLNTSGIPDLQDIEAQGQWNWDKLAEISRALTLDFNGDNIIDQYAISVNYASFISSMIYSNGGRYFREVDGKYLL